MFSSLLLKNSFSFLCQAAYIVTQGIDRKNAKFKEEKGLIRVSMGRQTVWEEAGREEGARTFTVFTVKGQNNNVWLIIQIEALL